MKVLDFKQWKLNYRIKENVIYIYIYIIIVPLVEFVCLVFTRMPGESYRRRLGSLLLYLCYVFRTLINSLVCRFFLLCFSVSFSNMLQIRESVVTFSVKSVDWIIQCLGKLIQNSSEIRDFSMNMSKLTTSSKLLFAFLSQCGDHRLKIIYIVYDADSWWCLTCLFSCLYVFSVFLWKMRSVFHSWL